MENLNKDEMLNEVMSLIGTLDDDVTSIRLHSDGLDGETKEAVIYKVGDKWLWDEDTSGSERNDED